MRIVNWNVGTQPRKKVHQEIERLMSQADIGVFSEMADQTLPQIKGFRGVQLDSEPGLNRNPVMYRAERLELLGTNFKWLVPKTFVGDAGAGPSEVANKYGLVLRFRDKETNKKWDIFPLQAIPSQYIDRRHDLHVRHMRGLAPMVARKRLRGHKTIVVGDFNEDFRSHTVAEKYLPGKSNHTLLKPLGTHGNRAIDAQIGAGVKIVEHETLGAHGSDHQQLLVVWK